LFGTDDREWMCWKPNGVVITRLDYPPFSYPNVTRVHAAGARTTPPLIEFRIPYRVLGSDRKSLDQN